MSDDAERDDLQQGQRLDKWLWHARFARTRSAAARLVADGYVRINAKRETVCAKRVRTGDVLTVSLGREVRVIRLRAFAPRRGSAPEAQMLYETIGIDDPGASVGGRLAELPCAPEVKTLADPR